MRTRGPPGDLPPGTAITFEGRQELTVEANRRNRQQGRHLGKNTGRHDQDFAAPAANAPAVASPVAEVTAAPVSSATPALLVKPSSSFFPSGV